MTGAQAALKNFEFPFSGKSWSAFSVGTTGSMTFGEPSAEGGRGGRGGRGGGLSVERFAELKDAGRTIINTVPAISVFFKPRMSGKRYLKELTDRAVLTWSLTEPVGGIQDMYWLPTVNQFQAVLHKDGAIEMSYKAMNAQDGIVGVYPMVNKGEETEIASLTSEENSALAPHMDIKSVKLAAIDGLYLKATIETRGPLPGENEPGATGPLYRLCA